MIYKRDGIVFMTLKDKIWLNPKIARIMPVNEDPWGVFKELEGSEWESLIPLISESVLDRAIHGDTTPLMRGVRDPKGCLKLAPVNKICTSSKECASFHKSYCKIDHKKMPDCFSIENSTLNYIIISAWRENYNLVRISND